MPALQNTNAGPSSLMTWGAAARRVARVVGGMNDPNVVAAARDMISEAIQEWNTEKNWRYLQIVADPIPVVSGTTRYPLPTNFKKPYDAYLVSGQKLVYVEAQIHDTAFPGGVGNYPVQGYMLFNVGSTGEIELVPNSADDTLVVRYYRPIIENDNDDAFLDMPSHYVGGILDSARARMCAEVHDYTGAAFWQAAAVKRLAWAKKDDEDVPDDDIRFRQAFLTVNMTKTSFAEIT